MIAIRIAAKNFHKILNESPIPQRDLTAMIEEYDTLVRDGAVYFVPQSDVAHELSHNSWMTIPRKHLVDNYQFDDFKIDNQFVEITRLR